MGWCENVDHDWKTQVALLTAVVGVGKSAVAHTIAHLCAERGILLSAFFFGIVTSPQRLWSGVARSLATKNESYRRILTSIMENDPNIAADTFDKQFKKLILEPLRNTPPLGNSPLVIVIDGFDECDNDAAETLAALFKDNISDLPPWVKFFVTSRPVRVVNRYFDSLPSVHHLSIQLSDDNNLRDCEAYVATKVSELKGLHWDTPPAWPPDLQDMLVKRARGLFVWVSVVTKYLRTKSMNPVVALEDLLGEDISRDDVPAEEQLDNLYTAIFGECNWRDKAFKHNYPIVMGAIVAAKSPLSIMAWEALLVPLLFRGTSVRDTISELRPLFTGMDEPSVPIQLLHQSVRDYLKWRPVGVPVKLEPSEDEERLALRCFTVINTEIRKVTELGVIEGLGDMDMMPSIPQKDISEQLAYACRYGPDHISRIQHIPETLEIEVKKFLEENITNSWELCVRTGRYIPIHPFFDWIEVSHGIAR